MAQLLKKRFFDGLDVELQAALSCLCDGDYELNDGTDLCELAAKAYLLGYRNGALQFQPKKPSLLVT